MINNIENETQNSVNYGGTLYYFKTPFDLITGLAETLLQNNSAASCEIILNNETRWFIPELTSKTFTVKETQDSADFIYQFSYPDFELEHLIKEVE